MRSADIHDNPILTGRIGKRILLLSLPILGSSLVQILYNTVDAMIVGNLLGPNALAAVGGTTSTAVGAVINFFAGIASGATVLVAQFFGAGDEKSVSKTVHTSAAIALVFSVLVSVSGWFGSEALLKAVDTPDEIIGMATDYMRVYFAGSFTIVVFNIMSGVYRALGENRKILVHITAGCVVNIGLDLLFVGPLGLGVKGAALATVISQGISVALCVAGLLRRRDCCRLEPKMICFDVAIVRKVLAIGIPTAMQSVVFSYTNLLVGAFVNRLGSSTASAWAAYCKLDAMFWEVLFAYAIGVETFVGQNYGAGNFGRCRKAVGISMGEFTLFTLVIQLFYLLFGRPGLALFVDDPKVIDVGMDIIMAIVPLYFTYVPLQLFCSILKGCGKTVVPSIVNVIGISAIRVCWLYLVPPRFDFSILSIMLAYGVSWVVSSAVLAVYYFKSGVFSNGKQTS